jgi:hypothetical protein
MRTSRNWGTIRTITVTISQWLRTSWKSTFLLGFSRLFLKPFPTSYHTRRNWNWLSMTRRSMESCIRFYWMTMAFPGWPSNSNRSGCELKARMGYYSIGVVKWVIRVGTKRPQRGYKCKISKLLRWMRIKRWKDPLSKPHNLNYSVYPWIQYKIKAYRWPQILYSENCQLFRIRKTG